jgi:isoleucyl-tRNA synthetase
MPPMRNWAKFGDLLILADALAAEVFKKARVAAYEKLADIPVATRRRRRLRASAARLQLGYEFTVPLLAGDHVTDDTGTGFVHTAPGHGREDFDVWTERARACSTAASTTAIPYTVDEMAPIPRKRRASSASA